MEALDIVNEILTHKTIACLQVRVHPGPAGYALLKRLKLLLYGHIQGILSTRKLRKHLRKNPKKLYGLGLQTIPDRRTIDRWKQKLASEFAQLVQITGNRYLQKKISEWTILDSTPLEDEHDSDARVGHTSKGAFKGFKLHMSCDEHEVPLRAVVTTGNIHDSTKGSDLLAPTKMTGGDAGYDNKELKKAARKIGSKPIFVHNPRREGKAKKRKTPRMLKKVRVVIEQLNGFVKNEVMLRAWTFVKGLAAKTVFALTSVLTVQGLALYTLKRYGYPRIGISWVRA